MRVFFDNCTSPVLAGALNALLEPDGGSARHITLMNDDRFGGRTKDVDWIDGLALDRPADWIVITADDTTRKNRAERLAWKRSGLKGFVLARAFQKTPVNQCAAVILWRWPEMEELARAVTGGTLFELPIKRGSRFAPLTV